MAYNCSSRYKRGRYPVTNQQSVKFIYTKSLILLMKSTFPYELKLTDVLNNTPNIGEELILTLQYASEKKHILRYVSTRFLQFYFPDLILARDLH